jgi:membrane protein YdbS with pleckstrin-like domain
MGELHLRPALKPYAIVYLSLIVLFIAAALLVNALSPDLSLPSMAVAGLLSLFVLIKLLQRFYLHISTEYIINSSTITQTLGLWVKDENHVPIGKVQDYKIDRSFTGKLLGVANVGIQTARAERGFEMVLQGIPEKGVADLKELLEKAGKD